jgi:hypothetical protein
MFENPIRYEPAREYGLLGQSSLIDDRKLKK